jgi:hypothetical protein
MMKLVIILSLFSLIFSCKQDEVIEKKTSGSVDVVEIAYSKCVFNDPAQNSIATICFDAVVTDSRCPTNVVCVWQGYAEVKLRLVQGGENISFKLATINLNGALQNETTINGIRIKLLEVLPYPGNVGYNPNDYKVKLQINW